MQLIIGAVSLFLFHPSFFSLSDLVCWSSARKQPQFPSSALLLWCLMLSPVSPLLGFSVIAQLIQLSFLVIAQYFSHGHCDLLILFLGLGDADNSHAAGCSHILPSSRLDFKRFDVSM
ncbi:hypothetical protein GOODEAATRI_031605 [Goodea atripinnis]|uniref:Uncharacterized protein n=1 Tax=Goodea atripinnis TaxID=208336 RepID=A0ABV0NF84_9TELE